MKYIYIQGVQGIRHGQIRQNLERLLIELACTLFFLMDSTVKYYSSNLTKLNTNICNYCQTECTMIACFHMDNHNEMRFATNTSYYILYALISNICCFVCCYTNRLALGTSCQLLKNLCCAHKICRTTLCSQQKCLP